MNRKADKLDDMLTKKPGRLAAFFARRSPDAHLLEDPVIAAAHAATIAEALRQPRNGYLQQETGHCTSPWGFDHRLVTVPGGHGGMPAPTVSRRLVELLAGRP